MHMRLLRFVPQCNPFFQHNYDNQVMEEGVDRKLSLIWNYIKLVWQIRLCKLGAQVRERMSSQTGASTRTDLPTDS